jgi:hypothetical protein
MEFIHIFATVITVVQELTFGVIIAMCENPWVVGATLLGGYLILRPHHHV